MTYRTPTLSFLTLVLTCLLAFPPLASISQNTQSTPEQHRQDSLRQLIRTTRSDSQRVSTMLSLATLLYDQQPDSGAYYAQVSLAEAIRMHQKPLEAEANKILGMIAIKRSQYNAAIGHTETALQIYESRSDIVNQGQCFNNLGITYYRMSDYANAAQNFQKALNVAEVMNDRVSMARMYNNVAGIRMVQGNFEEAVVQYRGALAIYKADNSQKNLAAVYNNLGKAYEKTDEPDSSIRYYLLSLDLRRRMNDEEGLASCFAVISSLFEKRNDYPRSLDNANKALEIYERRSDKNRIAEMLFQIGKLQLELKDYPAALAALEKSLNMAKELHTLGLEGRIYMQLSLYNKAIGDKKQAKLYEDKHEDIIRSIQEDVRE